VRAVQLILGGSPSPWGLTGIPIQTSGEYSYAYTSHASLVWPATELPSGELQIAMSGVPMGSDIDGIQCAQFVDLPEVAEESGYHVDHVVVMTNDLDRTCHAVAEVSGYPLKRVREVGEIRQGFHRIGQGGVIIEVVERADVSQTSLWGLVLATESFDDIVDHAGDLVTTPKAAVQPGRRISTVKDSAGLGVAVALMSV